MYRAIGTAVPAQATCPPCSYLWEGKCEVCAEGDTHPGCKGCVDGEPARAPWYKSDLVISTTSAVVVSLAVAMLVPRIEAAIKSARK